MRRPSPARRVTRLLPFRIAPRGRTGWQRDETGVSAVEFAFIAPVMVMIYFACIELSTMMMADRRVTNAASTLGDLVARDIVVDNAELTDIFAATDMIFQPSSGAQARMRVSCIYDDAGVAKVRWSDARGVGISAYTNNQTVSIPAGILPSGGSIIMAETSFDYRSSIGYFIQTDKTLSDVFFLRPRRTDEVLRDRS